MQYKKVQGKGFEHQFTGKKYLISPIDEFGLILFY
jgi:hypothetical protein